MNIDDFDYGDCKLVTGLSKKADYVTSPNDELCYKFLSFMEHNSEEEIRDRLTKSDGEMPRLDAQYCCKFLFGLGAKPELKFALISIYKFLLARGYAIELFTLLRFNTRHEVKNGIYQALETMLATVYYKSCRVLDFTQNKSKEESTETDMRMINDVLQSVTASHEHIVRMQRLLHQLCDQFGVSLLVNF